MSDATLDPSSRAPRGPRPRNFRCPSCGVAQAGRVTSTKSNGSGREIVRRLRCERCQMSYSTIEKVVRQGLEHLQVLDDSGQYKPFSRTRIENDVALWVRKTLSAEEITYVVDSVCQDFEQLLGSVPSTPSGLVGSVPPNRSNPGSPYVKPALIVQYVDKALERGGDRVQGPARERHRSARAQFGLAYFGRRHQEASGLDGLPAFSDARSVAVWLGETFRVVGKSDVSGLARGKAATLLWEQPSGGHVWRPQRVIKNFRPLDSELRLLADSERGDETTALRGDTGSVARPAKEVLRRTVVDFNENRLRESIRAALRGRRKRLTEDIIVQWVCLGLTGQRVVRTSQLSAGVAECLRMLDDVGYLRWVAIGKELSVEDLYEEALNVMRYPSPQLDVRQSKAPVLRPSVQGAMT